MASLLLTITYFAKNKHDTQREFRQKLMCKVYHYKMSAELSTACVVM